jgi:ATP-dependent Clp protease ATP-binding subunit ClpC
MAIANMEAQRFGHLFIGTEHILLGLIKEGSGVGANILKELGVDIKKMRIEVEKLLQLKGGPKEVGDEKLPQTQHSKKVIEYSIEEARLRGDDYVGSEHILLGLLGVEEGIASKVLVNLGVNIEDSRAKLKEIIG